MRDRERAARSGGPDRGQRASRASSGSSPGPRSGAAQREARVAGAPARSIVAAAHRLVIKVGSTLVTNDGRGLDHDAVGRWAAEIARLKEAGDLYLAAEIATGMASVYAGDTAKAYQEQTSELKKDPGYAVGKEYQKLASRPVEVRKDPKFVKLVEAFIKKNTESFYAKQAQALIAAK